MPLLFSAPAAALRPARWLQCGVARFCATPVVAARRTRTETPSAPAAAIEAKATKKSSKAAEKPSKADVNKPAVHKLIQDDFLPAAKAKQLRADYDRRFATPRKTETRAFMFDYWYVENQYNLLRAPASEFFPPKTYKLIEEALLEFGQSRLGCRSLTPVWLSLYIGGCRQDFHMDNANHGPWAFVYSITNWDERKFSGGETMILQKDMLSFWQNYEREKVVERDQILDFVEPRFNRLTCFDPRFPHGVRQVEGTINPMDARVVLHGWFTDPEPFFEGALGEEEATEALNAMLDALYEELQEGPRMSGCLTTKYHVDASGKVEVEFLTDNLVPLEAFGEEEAAEHRAHILSLVLKHGEGAVFPAAGGESHIIMPFLFD